jgi:hypothetical protein
VSEENYRILERTLVPTTSEWAKVPITIHQIPSAKKTTQVEVLGDTGMLVLYPKAEEPGVFETLPNCPEPTRIDFNRNTYRCPIGLSSFKLVERE